MEDQTFGFEEKVPTNDCFNKRIDMVFILHKHIEEVLVERSKYGG